MASQLVKYCGCFGFGLPDETEDDEKADPFSDSKKKQVLSDHMDNQSLGICVMGDKMFVFIPGNTKIPIKEEKTLITTMDFQSNSRIDIYEGESSMAMDNLWLGTLKLEELVPAPKGVTKIKVCFEIDVNGTLKVSLEDKLSSNLKKEITITSDQRQSAKISNAKKMLENYANGIKRTICDVIYEGKLKAEDKKKILKVANEAIAWLNKNRAAKVSEYDNKLKELEVLWAPIITGFSTDATGQSAPKVARESYNYVPPKAGSLLDQVD